jgi:uncharacterized protein (TIGR02117 family)
VGAIPQESLARPRRTLRGRIALYVLVALAGLIPVNNDFEPTADGVEIMVISTAIHADLVLPIRNETVDWSRHLPPSDFKGDVSRATHVAFGWGNREFYIDTPTWADVKAGTVFRAAFWPSPSCMHVNMWNDNANPAGARTRISHEQYRQLVEYLLGSFRRDEDGRFLLIVGGAYGRNDAFYQAHGSYHAFNTCNCWVGQGLKAAGVRTGWFTPLPKTATLYLPAQTE